MRPIWWKLGLTIIGGAMVGTLTGNATIAGMTAPGALTRPGRFDIPPSGNILGAARHADAGGETADYARIADGCANCSDYDLGYRFAAARQLKATADCMDYSWSYQRGCLAFLRDG